jgi:Tfp pilus assembly protein PilZ
VTQTVDQIEKQTIVSRLSVSIYEMELEQLTTILNLLENKPEMSGDSDDGDDEILELTETESPDVQRQMIIAQLFVLINKLDKDELLQRLRPFQHPKFKWIREYPRLSCYLVVDFAMEGKAYRSCIRDISAGGVFIETRDVFYQGQEISLCFSLNETEEMLPFKINGKVTRTYKDGIGVQYEDVSDYQRDILSALIKNLG